MIYIITTLIMIALILFVWKGSFHLKLFGRHFFYHIGDFTSFLSVLISGSIFLVNVIIVPIVHFKAPASVMTYEELVYSYNLCKKKQDVNCATISLKVYEMNSSLKRYKYMNQHLDFYYPDSIVNLELIR